MRRLFHPSTSEGNPDQTARRFSEFRTYWDHLTFSESDQSDRVTNRHLCKSRRPDTAFELSTDRKSRSLLGSQDSRAADCCRARRKRSLVAGTGTAVADSASLSRPAPFSACRNVPQRLSETDPITQEHLRSLFS